MQPTKAKKSFDHITLPCIQIFRGGELLQNLIRVQDTLGEFAKQEDVEWLLEKYISSDSS